MLETFLAQKRKREKIHASGGKRNKVSRLVCWAVRWDNFKNKTKKMKVFKLLFLALLSVFANHIRKLGTLSQHCCNRRLFGTKGLCRFCCCCCCCHRLIPRYVNVPAPRTNCSSGCVPHSLVSNSSRIRIFTCSRRGGIHSENLNVLI